MNLGVQTPLKAQKLGKLFSHMYLPEDSRDSPRANDYSLKTTAVIFYLELP
jgi:hypothetical protein